MSIPESANADPSAAPTNNNAPPAIPTGLKRDEPGLFDQSSPYLEYGDFNSSEEEDADTLYFQYGRFFGLSLGLGYQQATGNRGLLYQPSFPRFDLKVHYWFDFQFALSLGVFFANHTFDYLGQNFSVKLLGYGMDLKYYFDVRNAAAAITFANPFLVLGVGAISKNQTTSTGGQIADTDSTFSVNMGAGFEFPISHKKTYFILDFRYHTQSFDDTNNNTYSQIVPDLSGGFTTISGSLMFTW